MGPILGQNTSIGIRSYLLCVYLNEKLHYIRTALSNKNNDLVTFEVSETIPLFFNGF